MIDERGKCKDGCEWVHDFVYERLYCRKCKAKGLPMWIVHRFAIQEEKKRMMI